MLSDLQKLASAYKEYTLNKQADFGNSLRTWGKGMAGGAHELFVRPVVNAGNAVKNSVKGWFSDIGKDTTSWYKRNIWDSDPYRFSKIEKFLAGDAYDDALAKRQLDGYTPTSIEDVVKHARQKITPRSSFRDPQTGKVITFAENLDNEREKFINDRYHQQRKKLEDDLSKAGYSGGAYADAIINHRLEFYRKQRKPRTNVDIGRYL